MLTAVKQCVGALTEHSGTILTASLTATIQISLKSGTALCFTGRLLHDLSLSLVSCGLHYDFGTAHNGSHNKAV